MKLIRLLLISLLGVILTACGGDEGSGLPSPDDGNGAGPTIVSLQVTPATTTIPVGFEQQLIAIATLSDGTTRDVTNDPSLTWASSDRNIATLINDQTDSNGLATGVAPGTAIITASGTANGTTFSATAQLEVTNAVVTALQVTPPTTSVPAGLEAQFTAIATLSDGTTKDVTHQSALSWSSDDTATAIIENSRGKKGLATGIAPGTVIITASGTANGTTFSATAQLEVTNAVVTALQVTPPTTSVPAGLETQFTAIATLSDGTTKDVTHQSALSWSSDDTATAIIENSRGKKGLATGIAPGTVIITASGTANGTTFSATTQLEVTNAVVTALQVTPSTATVPAGLGLQFTAIAALSDGTTKDVTNETALSWKSSDITIATIVSNQTSDNGFATGVKPGTVTITSSGAANDTPFSAFAELEVKDPLDFFTTPQIGYKWSEADAYCKGLIPVARLPTVAELQNLFIQSTSATAVGQSNNEMCSVHGWPLASQCGGSSGGYWTSETSSKGRWVVNMTYNNPVDADTANNGYNVACVR
ncbi:Ig-like domain-containing protein [Aeromonas enteropelogenes]|uniref:Ig-like domain-containing protein n=1 Tax=Aeromonas enteropelogenes TaxID=29489 RepID=UPI003BA3B143